MAASGGSGLAGAGHSLRNAPVIAGVAFAIYLLLVLLPVGYVLVLAIAGIAGGHPEIIAATALSDRSGALLLRSIMYAAAAAAAALTLGLLCVTAIPRLPRHGPGLLAGAIIALIAVPPYIHALAWNNAVSDLNSFMSGSSYQPFPVSGWAIAWWVQVVSLLPFACLVGMVALRGVSRDLLDAGRICATDIRVLRSVLLPISAPIVAAGFGILFLQTLTEYSVPSLFSADTYALDIFAAFSATGSIAAAAVTALPLVMVALPALVLILPGMRAVGEHPCWSSPAQFPLRDWPWWFSLPGTVALVIMAAQIIVLPIGILAGIGDLSGVLSAVSASSGLIGTSLAIALVAVICGIPLAAALAVSLPDRSRARTLFWIAVTLPLAIPSPLIGMGLVAVWNPVLPAGADGSILLPVIAALARFLPIAILIMSAQIRLVDPSLLDAARFIPTPARAIRIVLPLLAPGLALAAVALFSLTLGELGATILVIPPGLETLTMKTYNYLHYGSFSAVAGLCALMAGLTIFVTGACLFLAGFWVRRFRLAGGLHHD